MGTKNRDHLVKPDDMSDADFQGLKDATASLERIRGDAHADVELYLANPDGWSTGSGSRSGLPTLQDGASVVVVGSLAGYDTHPAWYLNLQAQPNCWVQLDRNKSKAAARDATAAEREQLWPRLTALFPPWGYFQKQTDRPFPIVILSPTGPA